MGSFTESLASSVPVVVCPGFADQPVNARKACAMGVGLKVDRPDPDAGHEDEAAAAYRADVCAALKEVRNGEHFKDAAARCGENLARAGGVQRAVKLVLAAANGVGRIEFGSVAHAGA